MNKVGAQLRVGGTSGETSSGRRVEGAENFERNEYLNKKFYFRHSTFYKLLDRM